MAVRPRTNGTEGGGEALRLACWNADCVRGRKLQLEQFLSENGVDICLLNETHLETKRALTFANYVCHRTDRPAWGGGTAILVRKGIHHYAAPVSDLQQLEATAIHLVLATRPISRPMSESDLTECLSGGFPVLMASDLNEKQTDSNSRLMRARGSLLRD
jgi:exonuclease III